MDSLAQWLSPLLTHGSLLAVPLVLLGGLITTLNPCCLPMYPAVFGFIGSTACNCHTATPAGCAPTAPTASPSMRAISLLFVLGMASATGVMGLLTSGFGWVFGRFDPTIVLLLAAIPLVMGLNLLGLLPLRLPLWQNLKLNVTPRSDLTHKLSAYGAGFIFSLAIAPCATPILVGILGLVAMRGNLLYGGVLMFIYGLGTGLPILLIGHGFDRFQNRFGNQARQRWLRRLSGVLLIGTAFYIVISL